MTYTDTRAASSKMRWTWLIGPILALVSSRIPKRYEADDGYGGIVYGDIRSCHGRVGMDGGYTPQVVERSLITGYKGVSEEGERKEH